MKITLFYLISLSLILASSIGCSKEKTTAVPGKKTIVVTYSALASVVKELAGGSFIIKTSIPNGLDPHEWEPSAKDMESINKADLLVENGLGLEGGMEKSLKLAKAAGVKYFTVSDYINIRKVGEGEGIPSGDPDQSLGASDPHLWMDPLAVKAAVIALAGYIKTNFSIDLSSNAAAVSARLDELNASIQKEVSIIPPDNRKMVTGHESLGYFAQRYGFKLIGAVIPSLTTQAEVSASDMSALKKQIADNHVRVIFTELGTPPKVQEALARDAGVRAVPLSTHSLPADLSYYTFMKNLADAIVSSLK